MKHINKPKRKPCGPIENMNFDKTNLLQEVQSYNEGSTINYSSLAKKYNICNKAGQPAKNGGQIVKEFLKEQQVNVNMFRYNGKGRHTCNTDTKQSRKRKIKVQGGYSVPCDESVMKAKERLQKDIEDGKYCLGEAIVPKEYKKMVIKNNQVTEEIFTIYERKLSHTRHLQVWHDNSTIANNGYFIVTINTCYDKSIRYTREEYKEKDRNEH